MIGSNDSIELLGEEDLIDEVFHELMSDDEEESHHGSPLRPERVLVFTTLNLLSMLTICSVCHVDGTFKVCFLTYDLQIFVNINS